MMFLVSFGWLVSVSYMCSSIKIWVHTKVAMIVNQKRLCCSIYPYSMRGMIVWKEHHFYVLCHPSLRQGTVMNMSPENVVLLLHQHFRLRMNMTAAHLSDICSDLNHSMPVSSVLWGASEIWLRVAPSSWFLIKPIGVVGDIGDLEYQVEIGIFVGNMENLDLDCCVPPCIRAPAKGAPQCYFCISVVFTWEDLERRYWQSYCNTVVVYCQVTFTGVLPCRVRLGHLLVLVRVRIHVLQHASSRRNAEIYRCIHAMAWIFSCWSPPYQQQLLVVVMLL